jgi:hypothetical protein
MAQPWSYSFAFGDGESDSEDEDATTSKTQQMQGAQFTDRPVEQELSEDTRLARELDLSTRKDNAIFRKTPWTVAKTNAASRAAIKQSVPLIPDHHALKSSNGSFLMTENTKRPKEVLPKNLTDHFRRSTSRKETTLERAKTRPAIQEIPITNSHPPKKKEPGPQDIGLFPKKQPQPPCRRHFVSPPKNPLQHPPNIPKSSLPPKQPVSPKVEGMHSLLVCFVRHPPSSSNIPCANTTKVARSKCPSGCLNGVNYTRSLECQEGNGYAKCQERDCDADHQESWRYFPGRNSTGPRGFIYSPEAEARIISNRTLGRTSATFFFPGTQTRSKGRIATTVAAS